MRPRALPAPRCRIRAAGGRRAAAAGGRERPGLCCSDPRGTGGRRGAGSAVWGGLRRGSRWGWIVWEGLQRGCEVKGGVGRFGGGVARGLRGLGGGCTRGSVGGRVLDGGDSLEVALGGASFVGIALWGAWLEGVAAGVALEGAWIGGRGLRRGALLREHRVGGGVCTAAAICVVWGSAVGDE